MRLVNRSYTRSEVEINEGLGGGSRQKSTLTSTIFQTTNMFQSQQMEPNK